MQTSIDGIAAVTNEDSILNARNDENDLEFKARCIEAGFLLNNDIQMDAFLQQLQRVRTAKVYTLQNNGHFRSLILPEDIKAVIPIFNEAVSETERRKATGTNSVAIIRMIRGSVGNDDQFPLPYSQEIGVSGTWQISWVAANRDGTSPYTAGANYVVYQDYDNHISWIGGAPGSGNQYFVKLVRVVEIAETVPVRIRADVILRNGYELNQITPDIERAISSLVRQNTVGQTLYLTDVVKTISGVSGVAGVTNVRIRTSLRIWKGSLGGKDIVPIRGRGYLDTGADVVSMTDNKDGTGVVYLITADWLWELTSAGVRSIDWSPIGSEPLSNYPYWVKIDVVGDILVPDDMALEYDGVDEQLLTI